MIIRKISIRFWGIPVETGENTPQEKPSTLITNMGKGKKHPKEENRDNSLIKNEVTKEVEVESQQINSTSRFIKKIEWDKKSNFTIDIEQIQGKGEDGTPLLLKFEDNTTIIGVADGMGGAGGTVYDIDDAKHSGAYLASHIVTSIVEKYFINFKEQALNITNEIQGKIAEELKYHINQGLQQILDKIDKKGNVKLNIKSKLIKRLPTTLALSYIKTNEKDIELYNYCAGDSRIYSLDSFLGLHQLTEDNLVNHTDAFDNLLNDSKISNCINADSDYIINVNRIKLNSPQIIIASTDGAFGYLPTPVHFEHLLLDTIIHASSMEDWKNNLNTHFRNNQSDDISLSITSIGYKDFSDIKNSYKERFALLDNDVSKLNNSFQEIHSIESSLREANNKNAKVTVKIIDYETQINNNAEKSNRFQESINHLKSEINKSEKNIDEKMKEIDKIRQDIKGFNNEINKLSLDLNQAKKESGYLNDEFIQFKKQNDSKEIDSLQNKINSIKETRSKLNKDLWLKYKSNYEKYLKSIN